MKTLLLLRSESLTDLQGLVICFIGAHPGESQFKFQEFVFYNTPERPIERSHVSNLFLTLERRGWLRCERVSRRGSDIKGSPMKHYWLREKGLRFYKKITQA